jgi:regulator of sigma E protease
MQAYTQSVLGFVVTIGVMVTLHELGHFGVARACGVRVLRFAIGFGPKLLGWTSKRSGTEYVIGLLPLGGYVKMLDEREASVDVADRHLAFNTQTLGKRAAIVAAGPLVNLLLAVLLFAVVGWNGQLQSAAVMPSPFADSMAAARGMQGGERVTAAALGRDELVEVRSFEDLRWWIMRAGLFGQDLHLEYTSASGHAGQTIVFPLSTSLHQQPDPALFRAVGWMAPRLPAVMGDIGAGGAAQSAGLQRGDQVLAVNTRPVADAAQLRQWILQSGSTGVTQPQTWQIVRDGVAREMLIQPKVITVAEGKVGRIEAGIGAPPETVTVRYGAWEGLLMGIEHTWQMSTFSLTMLGRMLTGEASVKNLSGPIAIADYAGQSAARGPTTFLVFLAMVSVSLGVLNLLPLPVLDGGHLMYYLWEGLTGRPVSDFWMNRLQPAGLAVLLLMMFIAVFNDLTRYLS